MVWINQQIFLHARDRSEIDRVYSRGKYDRRVLEQPNAAQLFAAGCNDPTSRRLNQPHPTFPLYWSIHLRPGRRVQISTEAFPPPILSKLSTRWSGIPGYDETQLWNYKQLLRKRSVRISIKVSHFEAYLPGRFPLHGVEDVMSVLAGIWKIRHWSFFCWNGSSSIFHAS